MHFLQTFNTNMESSINFITPLEYIIIDKADFRR